MEKIFEFPFPPYDIQKRFMCELYAVLEAGKVGIFESPTGTGKSLSIACGALTWLQDDERSLWEKHANILKERSQTSDAADWLAEYEKRLENKDEEEKIIDQVESLKIIENRVTRHKDNKQMKDFERTTKRKASSSAVENVPSEGNEDEDLIVRDDFDEFPQAEEEKSKQAECRKIFYVSRTHSQLTQFLNEVKKTSFADSLRVAVLGSRQNYCVNETVKALKASGLINDRCMELRKKSGGSKKAKGAGGSKTACSCPFYRPSSFESAADEILSQAQTAEEVMKWSREEETCPYYASRFAVAGAQLVLLPYQMLLHEETRKSSGINLEGNVVIVDEAHNLFDAIAGVHSAETTLGQVQGSKSQLSAYCERYRTRLSPRNLTSIRNLIEILGAFEKIMSQTPKSRVFTSSEFIFDINLAHVNVYHVLDFVKRSEIAKKIRGFAMKGSVVTVKTPNPLGVQALFGKKKGTIEEKKDPEPPKSDNFVVGASSLYQVIEFLAALTIPASDGRILLTKDEGKSALRFLLLNPGAHFAGIVKSAHAVVLTGGTMQPCAELEAALKINCGVSSDRLHWFSCGHVIDKRNLNVLAVGVGPNGQKIKFDYQSRSSPAAIDMIGTAILNISRLFPGGMVVFCVSYDYLNTVIGRLKSGGLLEQISKGKRVFFEPKLASEVGQVLLNYQRGVRNGTGSILFAVIGGKMSEGINFSDDMGRCVMVIGLPYPNRNSPALQEKLRFLDQNPALGQSPSEFYESLCMKAVNQAIGRAIRHQKDYASIVLFDERYLTSKISGKLPKWISSSLSMHSDSFGTVISSLSNFFASHKTSS